MNQALAKYLFGNDLLIARKEKSPSSISSATKVALKKKKAIFWADLKQSENNAFLNNIVEACKITDFEINEFSEYNRDLADINVCFSDGLSNFYQLNEGVLHAHSLEKLAQDKTLKLLLWNQLKAIFKP
jgi:hypothetical protein